MVLRWLIDGIDVVLGMDVISQMGGVVTAMGGRPAMFGEVTRKCCLPVVKEDEVSHCNNCREAEEKRG